MSLNKTHPAHIGCQIIDNLSILARRVAGGWIAQIGADVFRCGMKLVPLFLRFQIYCANVADAPREQIPHDPAANEAARTGHDCKTILAHGRHARPPTLVARLETGLREL